MSNGNGQKDTVYIDVDDEITAVIDKFKESPSKIVALVLPKRATVFQSIVNMKLLKRTADNTKKNVVLITSEAALMPLAGTVGVHVAPNLQSKPEIPSDPSKTPDSSDTTQPETADVPPKPDESADTNKEKPSPEKKAPAPPKDKKKPKIPNFEKFRKRLILGGIAVVVLIVGWLLAFVVLPKATVALDTDTSTLDVNLNFVADPNATVLDPDNRILPASVQEVRATDTEKAPATGQKNLGNKASGSVSLQNCSQTTGSITIPSNTRISRGNSHFRTQSSVNLPESSFNAADNCTTSTRNVSVLAEEPGASYNVSKDSNFSVAGYSGVRGTNSNALTGGTDNVVKVVTQGDIDAAMGKIQERASSNAPDDLKSRLRGEGYLPLESTLVSGDPTITTSPNVGDEANEVTVSSATSYSMAGVKEDDLKTIIKLDTEEKIDKDTQVIQDDGLDDAQISVRQAGGGEGQIPLVIQTKVTAGPNLDEDALKSEIAGRNADDIKELLEGRPGINKVDVSFSPFWVSSAPKSTGKINIEHVSNNN